MSFSSDVKSEIIKTNEKTKKIRIAKLMGMLCFGARISKSENGFHLKFATENPKIARLLYTLIKKDCEIQSEIRVFRGKKTIIYFVMIDDELEICDLFHTVPILKRNQTMKDFDSFRINFDFISDVAEKKAFVQGAFLSSGSVISPQKNCHLEFANGNLKLCEDMKKLFDEFDLSAKIAMRKSSYVLYFKNNSDVADVLTLLGAYDSLMEFHNVKIMKEMRNSINRKMNCDTANMTKTLDAAFKQAQAIEKLKNLGVLDQLNDSLKEVAELRIKHKELGLKELGEMMNPPLGKSGVNHRLRKLMEEAEKYN
ncbi:MAG: DNA-binding protein WhiA [Clostridia bacterium]|nr:DNA-binding protein WhiA [Clostridia bacterium]